jgi:hypothetical protein
MQRHVYTGVDRGKRGRETCCGRRGAVEAVTMSLH